MMCRERTPGNKPADWKHVDLGHVAERITVGLAISVTEYYCDSGVPLIRNQNIRDGWFDGNDMVYIQHEFAASQVGKAIRPRDVLTVRTGANIGQSCVVPGEFANCHSFTTLITTTQVSELLPEYLCFHMQSPIGRSEIDRLQVGGGKGNLNAGHFSEYQLDLPPLPEQVAIVEILSTWDESIHILSKLISAKIRLRQGISQQLLSGKLRFPRFSSRWQRKHFGSFLRESRISGSNGAQAKKLTVRLYGNGVLPKSDTRPGSKATQFYQRRTGQFIYSKLDFLNGAFGIVPSSLDGYESSLDVPAFDIDESVDGQWLIHFVTRPSFYRNQLGLAQGGRKARRVNPVDLLNLAVAIPDKPEQTAIGDVLETIGKEIRQLEEILLALKQQKKGLMLQLLTGKVRAHR